MKRFTVLKKVLREAFVERPSDILAAFRELPEPQHLPSLWTVWLLIVLVLERERQRRWRVFLQEHLPQTIPPIRRLYRLDQPVQLIVPDASEWQVNLECQYGYGLLINRVTGEMHSVPTGNDDRPTGAIMFVESFDHYLKPASTWAPEARLLELHPLYAAVWYAIEDLEDVALIRGIEYSGRPFEPGSVPDGYRLTQRALNWSKVVLRFQERWNNPDWRLWLAGAIGDWLLARELAKKTSNSDLIAFTEERARECRRLRLDMVRKIVGQGTPGAVELQVFYDLGAEELPDMIRRALRGDPSTAAHAIKLLAACEDPQWNEEVFRTLLRFQADSCHVPADLLQHGASLLLRQGYRTEELVDILAGYGSNLDEVALLLLEFAPHAALPVIRTALRGSGVERMAAALALIDRPWSRAELLDMLAVWSDDPPTSLLPYVLALADSADPEAREVARSWESRYDPRELDDHKDFQKRKAMALLDRVAKIRDKIP